MRADRLLSILLLLQAHGRLTAADLARRLEVSVRTIHRDMEALGASGVPVVASRGQQGGWELLAPYRTDLTALRDTELRALFVPAAGRLLTDLGLGAAADAARVKLLASLPAAARKGAEQAWKRVHVDPTAWRGAPAAEASFPVLQEAVFQDRRLAITYERGDGSVGDRRVDPLGLVAKGGVWYLIAAREGEIRSYRVSRILHATLGEPFARPEDFDLAAFWEASASTFESRLPRFHLTARVAASLVPRLRLGGRFVRLESLEPPDAEGRQRARFRCDTEEEAIAFALGHGPMLEVLEPVGLRGAIAARAAQTATLYGLLLDRPPTRLF